MGSTRVGRTLACGVSGVSGVSGAAGTTGRSLVAVGDPTTGQVVGRELHLHPVAGKDADVMHTHLAGNMGQHLVAIFEFDAEHGVRQRLGHRPLEDDRIFFWLSQGTAPAREDSCGYEGCWSGDRQKRPTRYATIREAQLAEGQP